VEIIGNFESFKKDIQNLAGSNASDAGDAILALVEQRKLFVTIEQALPPDLKANLYTEVDF
jgi:hypothetical protein